MRKSLYLKIVDFVVDHDAYFLQNRDCNNFLGFTPIQKCAAAVRLVASGASADEMDNRYRLVKSTILETLRRFCDAIIEIFSERHMRSPDENHLKQLLRIHETIV